MPPNVISDVFCQLVCVLWETVVYLFMFYIPSFLVWTMYPSTLFCCLGKNKVTLPFGAVLNF